MKDRKDFNDPKRRKPGRGQKPDLPPTPDPQDTDKIMGRNAVKEALTSGRPINKAWILKNTEDNKTDRRLSELESALRESGVPILYLERSALDRVSEGQNHQGIIVQTAARDYVSSDEILDEIESRGENGFILILDSLQDGRNLGASLRVAECCAVDLVVIPERRSVSLDAYVAKASAGALEYVPVARETNLTQFVERLKKRGYWIFGSTPEGGVSLKEADFHGKIALIIGSEGKGMSQKLREHCDFLLQIPMFGQLNSLNASVACGILCFEAAMQRHREKGADAD